MRVRAEIVLGALIGASEMMQDRRLAQIRRTTFGAFLAHIEPMRLTSGAGMKSIDEAPLEHVAAGQPLGGAHNVELGKETGIAHAARLRRVADRREGAPGQE